MCWFSAHERISNRRAIEGEELVVHQFSNPHRRWIVSPREPEKAVCLPDGCLLRLNDIPESLQKALHVELEAVAEFHEVYHPPRSLFQRILPPQFLHDVLVFPNGSCFNMSLLPLGMRLDVLSKALPKVESVAGREWETETAHVLQR